ncbi:MAG TPA: secondary thiamine-phosphate synthase enzyme YjbQ [Bdellovibrionota bacterium]|nr:secondary thiamine-phosphate synthase enzyme YjbQ [Bdellovibrionota bacterium]
MIHKKIITLKTSEKNEMINITSVVEKFIRESSVKNGLCHVFVPHTTAGVTINENSDPNLLEDMLTHFEKLVPLSPLFKHKSHTEGHIKSTLVGHSETILFENGKLLLGQWQAIYYCEFSGGRTREVQLSIIA